MLSLPSANPTGFRGVPSKGVLRNPAKPQGFPWGSEVNSKKVSRNSTGFRGVSQGFAVNSKGVPRGSVGFHGK